MTVLAIVTSGFLRRKQGCIIFSFPFATSLSLVRADQSLLDAPQAAPGAVLVEAAAGRTFPAQTHPARGQVPPAGTAPCTELWRRGGWQGSAPACLPPLGDQHSLGAGRNTGALATAFQSPQKDKPAASRFLQISSLNYTVKMVFKKQHIALVGCFFFLSLTQSDS